MAIIDRIDPGAFQEAWREMLGLLKPGDTLSNVGGSFDPSDFSLPFAEARRLHKALGAVRDDSLPLGRWEVDWRDCGPKPVVRLAPNLFAHVADACEAA